MGAYISRKNLIEMVDQLESHDTKYRAYCFMMELAYERGRSVPRPSLNGNCRVIAFPLRT